MIGFFVNVSSKDQKFDDIIIEGRHEDKLGGTAPPIVTRRLGLSLRLRCVNIGTA